MWGAASGSRRADKGRRGGSGGGGEDASGDREAVEEEGLEGCSIPNFHFWFKIKFNYFSLYFLIFLKVDIGHLFKKDETN